jgi:outer membrane lipoprotein LolB
MLTWAPGSAVLQTAGQRREFPSLDALVASATGSPLPVAALFDWLKGMATPVPGWEPDLSQLADGRIRARRVDPPPVADLRVVLDR